MRSGHIFRKLEAGDNTIGTLCTLCQSRMTQGEEIDMVDNANVHRTCVEAFLARAAFYEQQSSDLRIIPNPAVRDEFVAFLRWLDQYEEFEFQAGHGALGWSQPTSLEQLLVLEQRFETWRLSHNLLFEAVTGFIM